MEGRPEWNLTPDVREAVGILDQAAKLHIKSVDDFIRQDGLFGKQKYSPRAIALANAIQKLNPVDLTKAARRYAQDANFAAGGDNLFGGNPAPEGSFEEAFGSGKQEFEKGRTKLMRPFSNVPFDELDPNLTKEDVLRNSQVFYRPGPAGYKGIVYVNGHARDILTHVGRVHTDNDWDGLWLRGPAAKRVMKRLETAITKDRYGIDAVKPLYDLRQALAQSIHDTGGALIVDAGHGQTFRNVRDTLRHELHHAHETDLSPEATREFLKNPLAQVAKKALRARGYRNDPVELASEIGAHLQGDPSGAALRLSPKEAELLWKRYAQYHPGELQFDWMHPKLREAAREATSQSRSSVLGKPRPPGEGSP